MFTPDSSALYNLSDAWRAVFWTSFVVWWLSEVGIGLRDLRAARGQKQDRGTRLILSVLIYGCLIGGLGLADRVPEGRIAGPPIAIFAAGIGLMWGGMALRLWAVATLGRFFRTWVFVQDDHRLVTTGPYRRLRNPSYSGSLLTFIGFGLALGNWFSLVVAFGCPLVGYALRIAAEERALAERFGAEFHAWRERSWALVPPIW
jgi:protein-S-isoprenylcysteine O-methyltransferase